MQDTRHSSDAFLTVEEAALRLGTSRLRVREAVARGMLSARRDNEGRLRVDLPERGHLPPAGAALEPDAVMGFLFDDIEEMEGAISDRDAQLARLSGLLARQDAALGQAEAALTRADAALAQAEAGKARLAGMLDRAFGHLEALAEREQRLAGVSDRSLAALEAALGQAEMKEQRVSQMAGILERAMHLAEQGQGTQDVAERAMTLLDDALARAEAARAAEAEARERGDAARQEAAALSDSLKSREVTLDRTLALSERATALAETGAPAARKGFWRRLLGL